SDDPQYFETSQSIWLPTIHQRFSAITTIGPPVPIIASSTILPNNCNGLLVVHRNMSGRLRIQSGPPSIIFMFSELPFFIRILLTNHRVSSTDRPHSHFPRHCNANAGLR